MNAPELFDIVELLVNLPEHDRRVGEQGSIVECYNDRDFEVEFANDRGETTGLCTLSRQQFIVVWKSNTKQWLTASEQIVAILDCLSERKQEKVLNYARFLCQKA